MFSRLAILSLLFLTTSSSVYGAPVLSTRQTKAADADINHLHDSTPMQGQGGTIEAFKGGAANAAAAAAGKRSWLLSRQTKTADDADVNHLHDSTPMQGKGGNVTPFKGGAENVAAQAGRNRRRSPKTRRTKLVSAVREKRQATADEADINHLHDATPMQGKGGNVTPFKGGAENVAAQAAAKSKRQATADDADINHLHDATPMQGKGGNVTPFKGGAENVAAQAGRMMVKRQATADDADINHLHDATPMQGKGGNVTPFKGGAENVAAQPAAAKAKRQAAADDADINHLHDSTPMQGKAGNVTPFKGGAENVAAAGAAKREVEGVNELQAGAGGGATAWRKMSKRQADDSDVNHFKTSVPTQGRNGIITTFKGAANVQKRSKF